MQEEVENRTLTLVVSGTKFTGRMFKAAILEYFFPTACHTGNSDIYSNILSL